MSKPENSWAIQGSGAFVHCRWCHGRGCLSCKAEYERFMADREKPIFTANPNDPEEMEELKKVIGREALEHAFGPDGDGVREVELNAAIQTLHRLLRTSNKTDEEADSPVEPSAPLEQPKP